MNAYIMKTILIAMLLFGVSGLEAKGYDVNLISTTSPSNTLTAQATATAPSIVILVHPHSKITKMGESLECEVTIEKARHVELKEFNYLQPWGDWVFQDVKIGSFREDKKSGRLIRNDKIKIMTMMDGNVEIPPLIAKINYQGNQTSEIHSESMVIQVAPKVNKKGELEAGIFDLKKPIWLASIWHILLAILIGLGILLGIWWFSRKTGLLGSGSNNEPKRPPEEIALEQLEALKNSDLLMQSAFKEYYVVLIDILRRYLSGTYNISATDRTTPELIKELKPILNRKDISTIRDLLERGDMIKFAKAFPDTKEIDQDWINIKQFVEETAQAIKDAQIEKESNAVNNKSTTGESQ